MNLEVKNYEDMKFEDLVIALKESEEKLENNKSKTEFFANMSHELKTPLNIIMGAMQLIELYTLNGTIKDPEKKLEKYMKNIKLNALRLLKLINNIIDMTKIEANDISIECHNYDIVDIVRNIVQSIETYAKVKLIKLTFNTAISNKIIACDADKIERIILNLLSNSLKFTNEYGNIMVTMDNRDSKVIISIKDDGIGMHKDKLSTIFQRFRQIDKSFTRNREGSGIGLSIVKALVEMHEGNIKVESEYGKGSKFVIEIPEKILEEKDEAKLYSQFEEGIKERVRVEFSDIQDIC